MFRMRSAAKPEVLYLYQMGLPDFFPLPLFCRSLMSPRLNEEPIVQNVMASSTALCGAAAELLPCDGIPLRLRQE